MTKLVGVQFRQIGVIIPGVSLSYLGELVLHGHELRAELFLVQVVESRDLVQPNRRVQLEVRTDLGEEDLLLHLFHKKLRLLQGRRGREVTRAKRAHTGKKNKKTNEKKQAKGRRDWLSARKKVTEHQGG